MSKKLRKAVISHSDHAHVKYAPATREECFDNIANALKVFAKAASQVEQKK